MGISLFQVDFEGASFVGLLPKVNEFSSNQNTIKNLSMMHKGPLTGVNNMRVQGGLSLIRLPKS